MFGNKHHQMPKIWRTNFLLNIFNPNLENILEQKRDILESIFIEYCSSLFVTFERLWSQFFKQQTTDGRFEESSVQFDKMTDWYLLKVYCSNGWLQAWRQKCFPTLKRWRSHQFWMNSASCCLLPIDAPVTIFLCLAD